MFEGTHNFKSFSASGATVKSYVRTIHSLKLLKTVIYGSFIFKVRVLYNMVRIIVGTLLELGKAKRSCPLGSTEKQDRTLAGQTAPPQGLCLKKVFYP